LGVAQLHSFLGRHRQVSLDTCIFIYHLEENPKYVPLTDVIFRWLVEPGNAAVTSTLTMTELLVPPYRQGDAQKLSAYTGLLATFPHLNWVAVSIEIADLAARYRAAHRLRTPDAIQVATAVRLNATGLLTNDATLARIDRVETLLLDDVVCGA